jgi:hypothetical protein
VRYEFRWNVWNLGHIAGHGVTVEEVEHVVEQPDAGYPEVIGDGKYRVRGQSADGRYLQAIYLFDPSRWST